MERVGLCVSMKLCFFLAPFRLSSSTKTTNEEGVYLHDERNKESGWQLREESFGETALGTHHDASKEARETRPNVFDPKKVR